MISASLVKELRESTGAGMLDCKKALEETNGNIEEAITWLREKGISKAAKKADRIAAEGLAAIKVDGNRAVIVEVNSETDFVAKNEEFVSLVNAILDAILNNDVESEGDVLELKAGSFTVNDLIIEKTSKIGEKLSFRRFKKIIKKDSEIFGSYIHMGGKIAVLTLLDGSNDEVAKNVAMQSAAMRPLFIRISDVTEDVIEKEKAVLKEQAVNEGKPENIIEKIIEGGIKKYYKENCLEEQEFVMGDKISVSTYVKNNGGTIKDMVRFEVGEGMEKREENFAEEVAKQINR